MKGIRRGFCRTLIISSRLHDFLSFRLAACLSTDSSVVLHFRGFLCAEAASFVLVLPPSVALMSWGGWRKKEQMQKGELAGRRREWRMPTEWRWAGSMAWEGLREVWRLGQRALLLGCSIWVSVLGNNAETLCSHESSRRQLTHPCNIQVLIKTESVAPDANCKALGTPFSLSTSC